MITEDDKARMITLGKITTAMHGDGEPINIAYRLGRFYALLGHGNDDNPYPNANPDFDDLEWTAWRDGHTAIIDMQELGTFIIN